MRGGGPAGPATPQPRNGGARLAVRRETHDDLMAREVL
jgi:hypothetical protein